MGKQITIINCGIILGNLVYKTFKHDLCIKRSTNVIFLSQINFCLEVISVHLSTPRYIICCYTLNYCLKTTNLYSIKPLPQERLYNWKFWEILKIKNSLNLAINCRVFSFCGKSENVNGRNGRLGN